MSEKTPLHLQKPLVVNHHNATTVTVNDETTTQPEHSHRSCEIPKHHCEGYSLAGLCAFVIVLYAITNMPL